MNYPTYNKSLNTLAENIHRNAVAKGFWDGERNMGEMLMLATSELSEAMEEHRSGKPNVYYPNHPQPCEKGEAVVYGMADAATAPCTCKTPKPEGVAVELVDCIIRCLDTLHSLGVDVDRIVEQKMRYNATRPHKHGKSC